MSSFTGGDECGQEDDSLAEQLLQELGCNHNDPPSDCPTSTCSIVSGWRTRVSRARLRWACAATLATTSLPRSLVETRLAS